MVFIFYDLTEQGKYQQSYRESCLPSPLPPNL